MTLRFSRKKTPTIHGGKTQLNNGVMFYLRKLRTTSSYFQPKRSVFTFLLSFLFTRPQTLTKNPKKPVFGLRVVVQQLVLIPEKCWSFWKKFFIGSFGALSCWLAFQNRSNAEDPVESKVVSFPLFPFIHQIFFFDC